MRKLFIAETGHAPDALPAAFGEYGEMTSRMLAQVGYSPSMKVVKVYQGDRLPRPTGGEDLLITGSPAAVYEDHSWIPPLEEAVRMFMAAGGRVVGICFGHQLMAQALGGSVEKSAKGWGVGVHTYDMAVETPPWGEGPLRFSCAVSHQDQVTVLPPGAIRLAGSAFCANGAIAYRTAGAEAHAGFSGLSFQMHPEFEAAFGLALLDARRTIIPRPVADLARASYRGGTDREKMAQWISSFLAEANIK
ncbi:MAG: type 1 glutamine amidotransferase [Pseudomonadota bacterium]